MATIIYYLVFRNGLLAVAVASGVNGVFASYHLYQWWIHWQIMGTEYSKISALIADKLSYQCLSIHALLLMMLAGAIGVIGFCMQNHEFRRKSAAHTHVTTHGSARWLLKNEARKLHDATGMPVGLWVQ